MGQATSPSAFSPTPVAALVEELEGAGRHLPGDADAGLLAPQHHVAPLPLGGGSGARVGGPGTVDAGGGPARVASATEGPLRAARGSLWERRGGDGHAVQRQSASRPPTNGFSTDPDLSGNVAD